MTTRRRETEWYSSILGFTNVNNGAQTANRLYSTTSTPISRIKGSTITRIIIKMIMHPSVITAIHEMHWGIVIVNEDAIAAGAYPDADDISDRADWLARGWLCGRSANLSDGSQDDRVELDLRSQRIMRAEEDALMLVIDNSNNGNAVSYAYFIRCLVKLPP